MPRLVIPDNTTLTTAGLGDGRGAVVSIEAVDTNPSNGFGRMLLSMGWGDQNMARIEMGTVRYPHDKTVYLQMYYWSYGTRYPVGYQPFNASRMRWWRLRECYGYLEAGVSADCSEWFTVALVEPVYGTDRDWFRGVNIRIRNEDSGRFATFDNLNIIPRAEADPSIPRARTLNFMRARTTGSFSGAGVKGAILDQGVTDAVRTRMGVTLYKKSVPTAYLESGIPNTPDTVTGVHGCLVSACMFPPGSQMHDIVIGGLDGSTSDGLIAYGILEAADSGAHVVNCSYGGGSEDTITRVLRFAVEQVAARGVLVFFSSGNGYVNYVAWPAAIAAVYPHVHSVGAFDERTSTRAEFSQYGPQLTGVTPGYFVKGLMPDGTDITWNGTSAASPHAARIAMLLFTGDQFTPEQVGQAMKDQRRQLDVAAPEAGGGAYDFAASLVYLQPHDTDGGTIPYTVFPASTLKRAVPGRSGTASWEVQAALPGVKAPRKAIEAGSVAVQALAQGPYPFGAQHPIYLTVGPDAAALPQAKGLEATAEVVAVPRTPEVLRPRKHIVGQGYADVTVSASAYETLHWSPIPREAQEFPFEFLPTDIRFIAQEILTRKWLHMDLPIVDPEITWNLSGPFELTGTLKPPYPDIVDIGIDEWSTFIHVEYRGIILGTGILMPFSSTADEMTIEAVGVTSYPHGIPYLEVYAEFFPDMMDVIRELWRHIQSYPNGNMGVLLPTGRMGMPLIGDAVYDDTTGELLGYERWKLVWTDFPDCGSLIDDFAQSAPFDYNEVHRWKADHSDILHGINFGYPRLGEFRVDLRFVEGENILAAIPIQEAEDGYASDVIVKGAGEGYDQIYAYVATNIWNRLRRVEVVTDERVTSVDMGNDLATFELVRRLLSRGVSSIVVEAFHPHASIGNYEVGDDILIEAEQPWYGPFALWHRITSIKFNPEAGTATLEVQRSESVRYGLWIYG